MLWWNPHFHVGRIAEQQSARIATRPIVLEGGFDDKGIFFHNPFSSLQSMVEVFRHRVIKLLVEREFLNPGFAQNLLSWRHSGFSIDNSVRVLDESAQENLAEYIARPPISLKKLRYEPFKGRVLFHTTYSEYFRENLHIFEALDFIAELTPDVGPSCNPKGYDQVRLLSKVYEIDPLVCLKCGGEMKVTAVIENPDEMPAVLASFVRQCPSRAWPLLSLHLPIKRILRHLVKIGRPPPGLGPDRLS